MNDDISVQVLHQQFRGGWGVLTLADLTDAGGGGGAGPRGGCAGGGGGG